MARTKSKRPFTEWLALANKLDSTIGKIALSRALRFCSGRGLSPSAVTVVVDARPPDERQCDYIRIVRRTREELEQTINPL
jgi:hypothetical protein